MSPQRSFLSRTLYPVLTVSMVFLASTGTAGVTAYVSTTDRLDLRQVTLVVVAPAELNETLRQRTLKHFESAGIALPNSDLPRAFRPATLTLTLDPQPLGALCPGKVFYAPSLTLTEPVRVLRTGAVIQDSTWHFVINRQVRDPIDAGQIGKDLDELINQFITDYQAANTPRRPKNGPAASDREDEQPLSPAPAPDEWYTPGNSQDIRAVSLSVLAEQWASALKANAVRQLAEAGFHTLPDGVQGEPVSLSLELIQQVLGDHCPGKVLYERGLYLVEEARVARRPSVRLWVDTWLHESVRIVPPILREELDSDRRFLLQEFIRAHHAQ